MSEKRPTAVGSSGGKDQQNESGVPNSGEILKNAVDFKILTHASQPA